MKRMKAIILMVALALGSVALAATAQKPDCCKDKQCCCCKEGAECCKK